LCDAVDVGEPTFLGTVLSTSRHGVAAQRLMSHRSQDLALVYCIYKHPFAACGRFDHSIHLILVWLASSLKRFDSCLTSH
jgi:hypothetical protein